MVKMQDTQYLSVMEHTPNSYPARPRDNPQQKHEMCCLGNCVPCITPPSPRWGLTLSTHVVNST
nr:MAG TPA: Trypsin inhibitors 1,2 and 3 [Caudoviricetes sp.]